MARPKAKTNENRNPRCRDPGYLRSASTRLPQRQRIKNKLAVAEGTLLRNHDKDDLIQCPFNREAQARTRGLPMSDSPGRRRLVPSLPTFWDRYLNWGIGIPPAQGAVATNGSEVLTKESRDSGSAPFGSFQNSGSCAIFEQSACLSMMSRWNDLEVVASLVEATIDLNGVRKKPIQQRNIPGSAVFKFLAGITKYRAVLHPIRVVITIHSLANPAGRV